MVGEHCAQTVPASSQILNFRFRVHNLAGLVLTSVECPRLIERPTNGSSFFGLQLDAQ
jgi:hypothetical protein